MLPPGKQQESVEWPGGLRRGGEEGRLKRLVWMCEEFPPIRGAWYSELQAGSPASWVVTVRAGVGAKSPQCSGTSSRHWANKCPGAEQSQDKS